MSDQKIAIRDPEPQDFEFWETLWSAYLTFCGAELSEDITRYTWQRVLDPTSMINARFAEIDGEIVGFAVFVAHDGTWTKTPICYLEDLYVSEACRGRGVGRALLKDLIQYAKVKDWARVYWHTKSDNAEARHLYDSFVEADNFVHYRLVLEKKSAE